MENQMENQMENYMENQIELPTSNSSSLIHYVAYSFLTIVVISLAYLSFTPQNEVEDTNRVDVAKLFEDLPYSVQVQYKTNDEFERIETQFNEALREKQVLLEEIAFLQEKESTYNLQSTESKMMKDESFALSSNNTIIGSATLIKDFAKCYDMEIGKYLISSQCRKNIISFVDRNKEAKYFEIIGIVDETEFLLYKNLEKNNSMYDDLNVTQGTIDSMKQLSQSGLAKYRTIEANWVIKTYTNRKANVYNANYNLLSDNGKKGFVIRAYE